MSFIKEVVPVQHQLIQHKIVAGGMLTNPITGRICDYAQAVHDGHFTVGGGWVPPNPFINTAINIHINELYQILEGSLDKSINTVWADNSSIPAESAVAIAPNGFFAMGETDSGSKYSAKKATEKLPLDISADAKLKLKVWFEKVKETAQALCPIGDYGIRGIGGTLQATIRIEPI